MSKSMGSWPGAVAAGTLLISLVSPLWGQEKPATVAVDGKVLDRQVDQMLRVIIDVGADIHNGSPKQGIPHNPAGCYHLWRDFLIAVRPLLRSHPDLQRTLDNGLAEAERMPARTNHEISEKAFALRKSIDTIRAALGPQPAAASLWNRLGGEANVQRVVDDFVALAANDPKVNFFRDGAFKDKIDVLVLKQRLVERISSASGGPARYSGRSMKETHAGMAITDAEFDAFADDLAKALRKNGAKTADIDAVLTAIGATRKEIVESGPTATLPTLWKQLGGETSVRQVVNDWLALAASDPQVNFSRGGKIKLTDAQVAQLKDWLVALVSQTTGGPIKYQGKSMREVHRGMAITNAEFDAALADLRKALEGRGIKPLIVQDVLKLIGGTRGEIVEVNKESDRKGLEEKRPGEKKPQPKSSGGSL